MKKLLIALLITTISITAYAYNATCPMDGSQASFTRTVNMGGYLMNEWRCLLNGHVFHTKA